jgi:hypothetical protein
MSPPDDGGLRRCALLAAAFVVVLVLAWLMYGPDLFAARPEGQYSYLTNVRNLFVLAGVIFAVIVLLRVWRVGRVAQITPPRFTPTARP